MSYFPLLVTIFLSFSQVMVSKATLDGFLVQPSKARMISSRPRAFVYEGFLTQEECDHLINLVKKYLVRSRVADDLSGASEISDYRTSWEMGVDKGMDPIITRIEDKLAAWTLLPKENGEPLLVLRYQKGQKYDPHHDFFEDADDIKLHGGHRYATVLMYLSDVEEGGETVFPDAEESETRRALADEEGLSDCARAGVAVRPRKGDALLFFSLHPNATKDEASLHAGCPVVKGEKWSATRWIHVGSFEGELVPRECRDEHRHCAVWARKGQCVKNAEYMLGAKGFAGKCRKSCGVC